MGAVVHIPEAELADAKSLLDMARDGKSVIIDGDGQSFRLTLQPGSTAADILRDATFLDAMEGLDDDWSKDLGEVIAQRKMDLGRDPWV